MHHSIRIYSIITPVFLAIMVSSAWGQDLELGDSLGPVEATLTDVSMDALDNFDNGKDSDVKYKGSKDGKGGKGSCDCAKAAAGSHKGVFYANNFDYICSCGRSYLGDRFKRLSVGNCWTFDVGGQYRARFHTEKKFNNTAAVTNGIGLTGADNDFLLHRTRLYMNAEYGNFRFYGEMLDALREGGNRGPRTIEENRTELQNLFVELNGMNVGRGTVGARIGRQEILLGAQRLVSPLDWANTRRTFDGARVMWQGDAWDVDAFWLRPMKRNAAHRTHLDAPNMDRQFYSAYATYKGLCQDNLEAYWLALDYEDVGTTGIRYDTIGTRIWGGRGAWLYELEGGVQFGENSDGSDHSAGFVTAGLGRKFECASFSPTLWGYYDWASGDDTVGNGFHHHEPLAHKYLGFMDLFGRRNIQDFNLQATAQLTEKTKLLIWYHYFLLANQNDVPYNVNMTNFAGLAGPSGSKDLGQELDVVLSRTITPRSSILFGYSHFFARDYYGTTAGVPFDGDADFGWVQWHLNF
ncbi:MAG: alginate export family protein [Pirellulaceae bacterium]|jgi:hypothetical protein|nr:alginate export family protein [Pirellulaceae bacterium]